MISGQRMSNNEDDITPANHSFFPAAHFGRAANPDDQAECGNTLPLHRGDAGAVDHPAGKFAQRSERTGRTSLSICKSPASLGGRCFDRGPDRVARNWRRNGCPKRGRTPTVQPTVYDATRQRDEVVWVRLQGRVN